MGLGASKRQPGRGMFMDVAGWFRWVDAQRQCLSGWQPGNSQDLYEVIKSDTGKNICQIVVVGCVGVTGRVAPVLIRAHIGPTFPFLG